MIILTKTLKVGLDIWKPSGIFFLNISIFRISMLINPLLINIYISLTYPCKCSLTYQHIYSTYLFMYIFHLLIHVYISLTYPRVYFTYLSSYIFHQLIHVNCHFLIHVTVSLTYQCKFLT